MPCRRLALCAALLLSCSAAGAEVAEGVGLFSPDRGAVPSQAPSRSLLSEVPGHAGELREGAVALGATVPSAELRSRAAEIDIGQLESARRSVEGQHPVRLNLNLFGDAEFEAVLERSAPTSSGYALTGRLADDPMSAVVLAVNGEWVAGTVWSQRGRYAIHPLGGGVAEVRQLGPSALGRCGLGAHSAEGAAGPPPSEAGPPSLDRPRIGSASPRPGAALKAFPPDDGGVIDLLVVYPSFARRSAGGHLAMRALIDSDVALTNEAYRASGAEQRLNLVGAVEVRRRPAELADRNMNNFIDRLLDGSDGYMDEAHELRDAYAADLILAHWGHLTGTGGSLTIGGVAGIAIQMAELSVDYAPDAFVVASSYAFAHELGHAMGLRHERANDPENTPFPYSHGYAHRHPLPGFRYGMNTIMSSTGNEWTDIPRFSNPNLRYPDESGVVIGVPGDEPSNSADGPADAVRSLNETRRVVANFRASASRCAYQLSPPPDLLPASGGKFRIGVRASPDCAWSAWSNDGFVSVLEGTSGMGDGELVFQVSANEGWERELAVFVAGEAYFAEQATTKERRETPVCDRAEPILEAIVEEVGKPCGEIAAEDLASIRVLTPRSFIFFDELDLEKRRLGPGAFDGLTGLVSLDLTHMELTGLEPGVFDGLLKLTSLDLSDNMLRVLRSGTLDGAPNLAHLKLMPNPELAALEPGAFHGLPNLQQIVLQEFRTSEDSLSELKAGTFEGLSGLWSMTIAFQPITKVEPGAFRGLSSLYSLLLGRFPLKTLEPGVFDGLPNLNVLHFSFNEGLTKLPLGLFDGLVKLDTLSLKSNGIETLEPGLFDGLIELDGLSLSGNKLKTLKPGVFGGLAELKQLVLNENELRSLKPGLFDGFSKLTLMSLSDNRLATVHPNLFRGLDSLKAVDLGGNELTTIDASLFDGQRNRYGNGYSSMFILDFSRNRLATLDPDLLRGMVRLKYLLLGGNRFTKLPPSMFEGLYNLLRLDLSGNPGAPFAFRPEFVRLPATASGSNRAVKISLEVLQGVAFDLRVALSVSGGSLSVDEATIRRGRVRGDAVTVMPDGAGPVIVRMADVSDVPGPPCLEMSTSADFTPCLKGVWTAAGAPLILYGLPDQTLAPDGAVRFDLPTAFPDFGEGTSYSVESSDPAAAEAAIREGLLIVSAGSGGETTVTVTATGPDGRSETRHFAVTALAPPPELAPLRSRWGGWRSALLRPPSSEDGDES